jgi:hypothetical protein
MEWKNTADSKPKNNQVVLASIDGIYKIVRFHEATGTFVELGTSQAFSLKNPGSPVYWTEIENPEV